MYFAILFVIFCTVCAVLAFARHPIYGLYFYFAATYVFPPSRWWGYMLGETRWSLIAAVVTTLAVWFHRGKLWPKPVWLDNVPAKAFVIYTLWMWVQSPWAIDFDTHISGSLQYTKYLVAFWFVYRIVDTKERARDVLLAHLLGCALLGIYAYLAGRQGDRLDGVGGPGMDEANTLGMYLATGAIVGIGLLLTQTGWRRWLSFGGIVLALEGLVLTNTRGAFLGLVAGGLVVAFLLAKAHRRLFWALAIIGLLGIASIVDQKFIDRMSTIGEAASESPEADASARSRFVLMRAQWQMFLDYPMGSGHRGTAALSARYIDRQWLTKDSSGVEARSSHNTFMTTLVEQGIPGALLYVWLTLWTFATMRTRQLEGRHGDPNLTTLIGTVGGGLAVIFVAGNTADFLLAEVQFWLFATMVSMLQFATMNGTSKQPAANGTIAHPRRV